MPNRARHRAWRRLGCWTQPGSPARHRFCRCGLGGQRSGNRREDESGWGYRWVYPGRGSIGRGRPQALGGSIPRRKEGNRRARISGQNGGHSIPGNRLRLKYRRSGYSRRRRYRWKSGVRWVRAFCGSDRCLGRNRRWKGYPMQRLSRQRVPRQGASLGQDVAGPMWYRERRPRQCGKGESAL